MLSIRSTPYQTYEVPLASFLVLDGQEQAFVSCDIVPDKRSPTCLILHIGWKRTCFPFVRVRTRRTKSCLLDSSYWTDEDMLSFCAALYHTDEVPLARFQVPYERGQALCSSDFIPNVRSHAYFIPQTGLMRTSSPFMRHRTRQTKSHLLDSSYRTDTDKLSIHATSYLMDEVPPA